MRAQRAAHVTSAAAETLHRPTRSISHATTTTPTMSTPKHAIRFTAAQPGSLAATSSMLPIYKAQQQGQRVRDRNSRLRARGCANMSLRGRTGGPEAASSKGTSGRWPLLRDAISAKAAVASPCKACHTDCQDQLARTWVKGHSFCTDGGLHDAIHAPTRTNRHAAVPAQTC